jgi:hypothetical protein
MRVSEENPVRKIYRIGLVVPSLVVLATRASASPPDTVVVPGDLPTVVALVGATKTEAMYSSDWAVIVADARAGLEQVPVVLLEGFSPSVAFSRSRSGMADDAWCGCL